MNIIGLDIGGANVKAADGDGNAFTEPFAIWKSPDDLHLVLGELIGRFAPADAVAVTMTGELADCFATKAEGVDRILGSVETAAGRLPVLVWQTGSEFVSPEVAREFPLLAAAANWHALATWCGRIAPASRALLIDVGTTTTDIIPLDDGMPASRGLTDVERLIAGELVYTGVRRTPVCAVTTAIPFRGALLRPAAELFATMHDVYLSLGMLPEEPDACDTANGRPASIADAKDRLARMLCCDSTEVAEDELLAMSAALFAQQKKLLLDAVDRVLGFDERAIEHILLSGSGEFLGHTIADEHPALVNAVRSSLSAMLSPKLAEAACAFAVARLAVERYSR